MRGVTTMFMPRVLTSSRQSRAALGRDRPPGHDYPLWTRKQVTKVWGVFRSLRPACRAANLRARASMRDCITRYALSQREVVLGVPRILHSGAKGVKRKSGSQAVAAANGGMPSASSWISSRDRWSEDLGRNPRGRDGIRTHDSRVKPMHPATSSRASRPASEFTRWCGGRPSELRHPACKAGGRLSAALAVHAL